MTAHNQAKKEEIAKIVLMPGDPLRAKYIAENFLEEYKLVNQVRNIYAYTGKYKGKEITVMASGMGMPSMGIYAYELYKEYDVNYIIRIGSCGAYTNKVNLLDTILVNKSYTMGNFALNMTGEECHIIEASEKLNKVIEDTAKLIGIKYCRENMACTECFDPYLKNIDMFISKLPKEENIVGSEMEAFALFYIAKMLGKDASCLLTVVDSNASNNKNEHLTSEKREKSLNDMILLALESSLQLK